MSKATSKGRAEYDKKYYLTHKEQALLNARKLAINNLEKKRQSSRDYNRRVNGSTPESLAKSETWFARKWEIHIAKVLGAQDMNKDAMGKPYDLLWKGNRINLKVSHKFRRKTKRGRPVKFCSGWWSFRSSVGQCDFYLCIGLDDSDDIQKTLLIPACNMPKNGISVGVQKSNKFNKYVISILPPR